MKKLLPVVLATLLAGCSTKMDRTAQFKELGVLGQHDVIRIRQTDANAFPEPRLQIFWGRNPGEIFATTLPFSMLRFNFDQGRIVPSVQFIFDENYLSSNENLLTESEKTNVNWLFSEENIKNKNFRAAVLRLNRADFQRLSSCAPQ